MNDETASEQIESIYHIECQLKLLTESICARAVCWTLSLLFSQSRSASCFLSCTEKVLPASGQGGQQCQDFRHREDARDGDPSYTG